MTNSEKAFKDGHELGSAVCQQLNLMGVEEEFCTGFLDGFFRQHNTLQQNFGRVLIRLILTCAEKYEKGQFDLRNEALYQMCHTIAPLVKKSFLPFV